MHHLSHHGRVVIHPWHLLTRMEESQGIKLETATISAKLKTGTKITISKKIKVVPTNQQIDPWE